MTIDIKRNININININIDIDGQQSAGIKSYKVTFSKSRISNNSRRTSCKR